MSDAWLGPGTCCNLVTNGVEVRAVDVSNTCRAIVVTSRGSDRAPKMTIPEGLADWVFANCNDRPDLLVELRDIEGWSEKEQRLYVCDAAVREIRANGFGWAEESVTVEVARRFAGGTADADQLAAAHEQAVRLDACRPTGNPMMLYTLLCCGKNAHNAAVMCSKQAWIDSESTRLASEIAMRDGALSEDKDDAREHYAVGERLACAHTEALEQCEYLRRTRTSK